MGKLDPASALATTRGKTGGLVISSNATGSFVRPWFMPRRPRTPEQQAWVAKFAGWAQAWRDLWPANVALWEAAALLPVWGRTDWFGVAYQPSGFNLWLIVAAIRDSLGLDVRDTPPTGAAVDPAPDLTVVPRPWDFGANSTLTVAAGAPVGTAYVQVEVSPYISYQDMKQNKPFRPFWAGAYAGGVPVDVQSVFDDLVGRLYGWNGFWFRYRILTAECVPGVWRTYHAHVIVG